MQPIHSVAAVRAAESKLIGQLPENELMHRAAFGLAVEITDILRNEFGSVPGRSLLGLIGSGSNGSDALWALALLAKRGLRVSAIDITAERKAVYADKLFSEAGGNWLSLAEWLNSINSFDLLVDGIAGLGSSRAVPTEVVNQIQNARTAGAVVVAVDLPSGLDADSAMPIGESGTVEADFTVTFGCLKPCHAFDPGLEYCGEVRLVDIGIDAMLPPSNFILVGDTSAAGLLPKHDTSDNKYSRGVVNVLAGSAMYPGAGLLASSAARWGGAGMVRHVGAGAEFNPESASVVLQSDLENVGVADAWVVGPGLEAAVKPISTALATDAIVVLDAQALNLLSTESTLQQQVGRRTAPVVLTPHGGEFRRLLVGYRIEQSNIEYRDAQMLAQTSGAVVYLKGSIGVVATPAGEVFVTRRTSEHLATAGTGDVLAGLLGSWLAATVPTTDRAVGLIVSAAVIAHSLAAELVVASGGIVSAERVAQMLPNAIASLRLLVQE